MLSYLNFMSNSRSARQVAGYLNYSEQLETWGLWKQMRNLVSHTAMSKAGLCFKKAFSKCQ